MRTFWAVVETDGTFVRGRNVAHDPGGDFADRAFHLLVHTH